MSVIVDMAGSVQFPGKDTKLIHEFDIETGAHWIYMNLHPKPCFTPEVVREVQSFQDQLIATNGMIELDGGMHPVRFQVSTTALPDIFSLGGDLELFRKLILARDRASLARYARTCIDIQYQFIINYNLPLTTIALVKGDAFGGGFEFALTSDFIIAERSARMGLPEILFNLFPGMGAYSLLSRRVGIIRTEEIIMSGDIFSAEQLADEGVIDLVVDDGEGRAAVSDFIKRQKRRGNGYRAVQKMRNIVSPIELQELVDGVTVWVDAAMQLGQSDLNMMDRLIRAQQIKQTNQTAGRHSVRG